MLNHRRKANRSRSLTGLQLLPRGPIFSEATEVLRQYDERSRIADREEGSHCDDGVGDQILSHLQVDSDSEAVGSHREELVATFGASETVCRMSHDGTHMNNGRGDDGISVCGIDRSASNTLPSNEVEMSGTGLGGGIGTEGSENSEFRDSTENDIGVNDNSHVEDIGLEEDFDSELDDGFIEDTPFHVWAQKNKKWIDLYLRHGLRFAVMYDILETACLGYKSWKTVLFHLQNDTGLQNALEFNAVFPGHMCYVHDSMGDDETV